MAEAKCPCCEGREFEAKTVQLRGEYRDSVKLIACAACGAVAGTLPPDNTPDDAIKNYLREF